MRPLRIGVIGDFDRNNPTHIATNAALEHAGKLLGVTVDVEWPGTDSFERESQIATLESYGGLWAAPGSPYKNKIGAINAIRFAREHDWPFVGT